MRKTDSNQDTQSTGLDYQAWDYGGGQMFARAPTLRGLIKALHESDSFWIPIEDLVVTACFKDARTLQVPAKLYTSKKKHGIVMAPLDSIPEHFSTSNDISNDSKLSIDLLSEQEFFRSQGYTNYNAFELAQQGKTYHDWIRTQAEIEGKSIDALYEHLFTGKSTDETEVEDFATEQMEQEEHTEDDVATHDFIPDSVADSRKRALTSIVRRQGQPGFRQALIEAYEARCAITGCNAVEALEAAHIIPYRGPETNHASNGLLLRADLHTLFDLGLIAIDATTMSVLIADKLRETTYAGIEGRVLQLPKNKNLQPNAEALDIHKTQSKIA